MSHSSCVQRPCRRLESHWRTVHQCCVPLGTPAEHQTGPVRGGIPHRHEGNLVDLTLQVFRVGYLTEVLCVCTVDRLCQAAASWHYRHCINAHALPGIALLFVRPKLVKGTVKLQAVTLQLQKQAVQALKCDHFNVTYRGFCHRYSECWCNRVLQKVYAHQRGEEPYSIVDW